MIEFLTPDDVCYKPRVLAWLRDAYEKIYSKDACSGGECEFEGQKINLQFSFEKYDERFTNDENSICEIWVPIKE